MLLVKFVVANIRNLIMALIMEILCWFGFRKGCL